MNSISKLFVKYHGVTVGELGMTPDGSRCVFSYDKDWLASGFSISPLDLPLKSDLFIAPEQPFWGNFGIFEDSLPDGYGRYLLNRMLRRQGIDEMQLSPLQRLSIVGDSGMGAPSRVPKGRPFHTPICNVGFLYKLNGFGRYRSHVIAPAHRRDDIPSKACWNFNFRFSPSASA